MRRTRFVLSAALVAFLGTQGCVLIPEIKEKVVELAVGGSTSAIFDAAGDLNVHDDSDVIDVSAAIDLAQVLDQAGIDVADVKDIKVSGISYRVIRPDPEPTREIRNGNVTVQRVGVTGEVPIITGFDQVVNSAVNWQTATVEPEGVDLLNQLLQDLLASVQNGTPLANPQVAYHLTGDSYPQGVACDFAWEIKVTISVLGEVKVDVPE